ncbi:MAG: SDR family oxidoreductase [Candidatus Rhabdochlamydia sp.]
MAKVFVTGSTGFVGKRLISSLLEQKHEVYALCRTKGLTIFSENKPHLYYIWGDLKNPDTLAQLPKDIDAAYYLVHSMSEIISNLSAMELEVANQFVQGIKKTDIKQIIYLGGIINDEKNLSPHLRSRLLVEEVLKKSSIPTTILRASIIIGSGSASFEIIRDLSEKLPFMIAPKWVNTLCQPIAIRDVLFYLSQVLLRKDCYYKTFDIGGPDILRFKDLLLEYAKFRKLKRWIIDVPILSPRLSSYWLVLITSVRFSLCSYLVESMKISSVCQKKEIQKLIPHRCLCFQEALELAFKRIAQNEVLSTWMDAWESTSLNPSIQTYIQVPKEGCLTNQQIIPLSSHKSIVIERIWCIGGATGWYALNWSWRVRGLIDRLIGGVGLNLGRRHPFEIQAGDTIDFWRVLLADKKNANLILYAGMKLPGEAWLQFKIENNKNRNFLIQTATFRPKGILGRAYWYVLAPFHFFIFRRMAKKIAS